MWFMSDNTQPAAPEVMAAVARANEGHAPSYGAEAAMARVRAQLGAVFEAPEAEVHLVATGTAANALALACLCPPWGAVYCHGEAHVNSDECGAPEFYTAGAKLVPLEGRHGRIDPAALDAALAIGAGASVHNVQPAALSLTNATEAGTVYDPDALAALTGRAHAAGLAVHLDGARFANAVAGLGRTPAELSWKAGVDVLTLGGTKDGCLGVEAVIFFDPARAAAFGFRRKRAAHLFSKHRYLSAQMEAWLADGLWLDLAARANARAAALAEGLAAVPGVSLAHPVEANAVFARFRRGLHKAAMAAGAEYHLWEFDATLEGPDDEPLLARFVCGWATTEEEVSGLLGLLRR
jgi:threonine aldolase